MFIILKNKLRGQRFLTPGETVVFKQLALEITQSEGHRYMLINWFYRIQNVSTIAKNALKNNKVIFNEHYLFLFTSTDT